MLNGVLDLGLEVVSAVGRYILFKSKKAIFMDISIKEKLQEYITLLNSGQSYFGYLTIQQRINIFILNTFSKEIKDEFDEISKPEFGLFGEWGINRQMAIGYIESLIVKIDDDKFNKNVIISPQMDNIQKNSNIIFIVHGRDNELKETVARFIQNIGLEPIILHEQANSSNTVIEKLEKYSNVSFAIVLLTPDDLGCLVSEKDKLNKRARQNVILELGYFIGKLGRSHVCALKKDEIELPSDYHGILYINFDSEGAWKTKLAQEIVESGIKIYLDGIIK